MRHWFHPPVYVETADSGVSYAVTSVEKAAELLLEWPERGPEWRKAMATCADAIRGDATAIAAREAFLAAAREADRLVPGAVG